MIDVKDYSGVSQKGHLELLATMVKVRWISRNRARELLRL